MLHGEKKKPNNQVSVTHTHKYSSLKFNSSFLQAEPWQNPFSWQLDVHSFLSGKGQDYSCVTEG